MVKIMVDLWTEVCVFATGVEHRRYYDIYGGADLSHAGSRPIFSVQVCTRLSNWVVPLICALPLFWRLNQVQQVGCARM